MSWFKIKQGASHGGVSPSTFEDWLKDGLRYIKLPSGTRLTKPEWIDQYLVQFEVPNEKDQVDELVSKVMGRLQ